MNTSVNIRGIAKYISAIGLLILAVWIWFIVTDLKGRESRPQVRFRFVNNQKESGISFRHHPTHDSAKYYKANHYDHGVGILAADVNNDDRIDVYFLNQIGPNALYKNLGNGRFEDMTQASGTGLGDRVSVGGSFADYDNDGDQDLFVTSVRIGNVLLENDGKGAFTDVTEGSGLEYKGHSSGSVFFDFDNDGLLDLFLVNVGRYTTDGFDEQGYYVGRDKAFLLHLQKEFGESSILYKNLGNGRFKDVTGSIGIEVLGWNGDATVVDYNDDGYPDLYLVNMQGDDQFFENVGGQSFKEITDRVFSKTAWGAMGVKFFDYNNDLQIDLMTTDMHSDMMKGFKEEEEEMKLPVRLARPEMGDISNNILGNTFYKNLGNQTYQEISDEIGAETYWPWGISVEDLNADGYQDIFVASGMGYPFRYGRNIFLLNNRGEDFKHTEIAVGIEPRATGNRINDFFRLDCEDADRQRRECVRDFNNGRDCQANEVCYEEGFVMGARSSRSSVIFDIDNDGDLDIITNEFNDFPQVLISNLAQENEINFLKVKLIGMASNKDAVGARVTIFYGNHRQVRYVEGKSGHLSQSQLPLYFGLGHYKAVDRMEIVWPSGRKQVIDKGLEINELAKIIEDQSAAMITTWAGDGTQGDDKDGHDRRRSWLNQPIEMAFGPDGMAYLADWNNHRVRRVRHDGRLETVIGTAFPGDWPCQNPEVPKNCEVPLSRSIMGTKLSLNHPMDILFTSDGTAYIAAWHNHKIYHYNTDSGLLTVVAGQQSPGFVGDGGPAARAKLNFPASLVMDKAGNLFVSDQRNNRIRRIANDTNRTITTIAGSSNPPTRSGHTGDGGPAQNAVLALTAYDDLGGSDNPPPGGGLAMDGEGNLYIAETFNHCVRKIVPGSDGLIGQGDPDREIITTVAGTCTVGGFGGDGGPAIQAKLNYPYDLDFGSDSRLYVADTGNHVVRSINFNTGRIDTVAGTGMSGFSGDGGPATLARLYRPYGIAFDHKGDMFIVDTMNNRVREVTK
jgi:hypothetical protein